MTEENQSVSHAFATLEHIVKSVVEKPDEVQIDIQVGEKTVDFRKRH